MTALAPVFDVPFWAPPAVAFVISFFTCVAGISGAFLLVPLQLSVLGSAPSISATTHLYNAVAIPGGVASYWREGRIVWPLATVLVAGTIPGVIMGAFIRVQYFREPTPFKIFVAFVLAWIGLRLLRDLLRDRASNPVVGVEAEFRERVGDRSEPGGIPSTPTVTAAGMNRHGVRFTFCDHAYVVRLAPLLVVATGVGVVGGVYGIGGGSIVAPFLVSILGLPVYAVAGPALLSTFVTSAVGLVAFQVLALSNPGVSVAPDWLLGLLLGVGGMAGMYLGGRAQKHVPATAIRWMLAVITILLGAKYIGEAVAG